MHITFVLPTASLGGGTRVVAIYAQRLQRRGHDVQVISLPPRLPSVRKRLRSLLRDHRWLTAATSPHSHLDGTDVHHTVIDRWRPVCDHDIPDGDVVIATWWETAEWVNALSATKGAKAYFVQGHEVFPRQPADRVKATYSMSFHKIVVSKVLAKLMREVYGARDVSLVPNSVDTEQFTSEPRGKQRVPTVGLLYSPAYVKGCDISLRAFELVRGSLGEARLLAFGLSDPVENLPLPAGTKYVKQPPQDRIRDVYGQCDVWLCGSRSEGFHLPPLEAMACRCPVVSTYVGGPADTIENGVNGYLVEPENFSALAERVVQVISMPDQHWKEMSHAAYATAMRYTWEDATKRFEAALVTAMERSQNRTLGSEGPL